jgi:hypothetical protein
MDTQPTTADALTEIRRLRETAEKFANSDQHSDVDQSRVLAGMIHQLAEQVERLASAGVTETGGTPSDAGGVETTAVAPSTNPPTRVDRDAEAALQEDRSPERGPADPIDDRADD